AIDDWIRLDRFLILGAEGGTYYVGEHELTVRNAEAVRRCIESDGQRTVERIVEISEAGRAPKNDPALFALAMCAGMGDAQTRETALRSLSRVARIGTHLFHFTKYVQGFRGWGRGLTTAAAHWYNDRTPRDLAYQALKYQARDGWSHRDVLRLCHPKPPTPEHAAIYNWITQGWAKAEGTMPQTDGTAQILAYEQLKTEPTEDHAVKLIRDCRLTREMIPTQLLNSAKLWEALLQDMPMGAMVRSLGKMTNVGLLVPLSNAARTVSERLRNQERIRGARLHPLSILAAMRTYAQGKGFRGSLSWTPVGRVLDALDEAFYLSFDIVEPTGKNLMLALDVSGSMSAPFSGSVLSCCEAASAMAMVAARTESQYLVTRFNRGLEPFPVTPRQRLDDVLQHTRGVNFGGTDCALPMIWALEHRIGIDAFIIYTDNETWAGNIHPTQALQRYREQTGYAAKLIVVGMISSGFTIADPEDAGMLDVVGFDTAAPQLMSDFVRGF
ncbi:MAG: TROVE domain-containing protein, partial [Gammaproteobacteria bacterium]|nr:TROVE domain-containing protein [Gammaproteobacteria bacterium]